LSGTSGTSISGCTQITADTGKFRGNSGLDFKCNASTPPVITIEGAVKLVE
jgi:hypothetical protein